MLLRIERVAGDGDGLATLPDGAAAYVPGALPGELVEATLSTIGRDRGFRAGDVEVLEPIPERVVPPCPHFGACGGCVLQHWDDAACLAWKSGRVAAALARAGFPEPVVRGVGASGARRRMDFAVRRGGSGVLLGLHAREAARVVDVATCAVLEPALVALLAPLRGVLRTLASLRAAGSVVANLLDTGIDLLLRLDAAPGLADRQRLIAFARAENLARLSWALGAGEAETVCAFRPACIDFAGVAVRPPPGAFLQASRAGETAIVAAVEAGLPATLPRRAWVADLFAGCGTLTFPLARHGRVAAFEGDAAAATALGAAARAGAMAGRVAAHQRDLARRPLLAAEFAGCVAAVLDPPHAGAAAQIVHIAAAGVPRVVYVSCNPDALGRDAGVLRAAGYRLLDAVAIDQFRWSARVESVAVFAR